MASTTNTPPTDAEKERAAWRLLNAQIAQNERQTWWEPIKATAMILLAAAAISAAGGLSGWLWPPRPQTITVNFGQPLTVQLQPAPKGD